LSTVRTQCIIGSHASMSAAAHPPPFTGLRGSGQHSQESSPLPAPQGHGGGPWVRLGPRGLEATPHSTGARAHISFVTSSQLSGVPTVRRPIDGGTRAGERGVRGERGDRRRPAGARRGVMGLRQGHAVQEGSTPRTPISEANDMEQNEKPEWGGNKNQPFRPVLGTNRIINPLFPI